MSAPTVDPFGQPDHKPAGRDPSPYTGIPDPLTGRKRRWVRVSTVARAISNEYLLNLWKLRMACKGMALRADLCARILSSDDREDGNAIAEAAMEAAKASEGANNGTALHDFTKLVDLGRPVTAPNQAWTDDIEAYRNTLDEWGFELVPGMVERTVCLPELGIIGTFDRLLRHRRTARLYIGDLKTAGKIWYGWGEIATQLSLYSRGSWLWHKEARIWTPMADELAPLGELDLDQAVVMHIKIGTAKCRLHWIPIDEGWESVEHSMWVRDYHRRARKFGVMINPPKDWAQLLSDAYSVDELSAIFHECASEGEWTDELEALGMARLKFIQAYERSAVSA
jgi:hypothetical protein